MKRLIFFCGVLTLLIASPAVFQTKAQQGGASASRGVSAQPEQLQAMVTTYCAGCHNSKLGKPAGGLALDTQNVQAAAEHPEIWEKVIRKLRGRLMPPPGANQPDQKDIDSFLAWMENTLDTQAK